jgi:dihydroorotase
MKRLLKNGRLIDPASGTEETLDLLIADGKVAQIKKNLEISGVDVIDLSGCLVTPGLIDIHVHLRDPGFPEKETIETGTRAAAAGGFTAVVCMPNTSPVLDSPEQIRYVVETSRKKAAVRVYPAASMTYGLKGERMTDFPALKEAGAVTFTEDGKSVMDPRILYEAFRLARELDIPISSHCEEHCLVAGIGAINRGKVSRQLGDPGIPSLAEDLVVARDILFAEDTGARVHIQHVSTARAVQLIREAKQRGVRVTAEAAPHHFILTDEAVLEWGTLAKVNPPLRTAADVEAVITGLQDGTIDVIATDHAPHTEREKAASLAEAPFGLLGLETAVGLVWTKLVHTGKLSQLEAVRKLSLHPAKVMNLPGGRLAEGEVADLTVIDPQEEWTVDPDKFFSASRNTPFAGMRLKGKVKMTLLAGEIVYRSV